MTDLLNKPFAEISVEDLKELINQKVPESEQLEHKSTPPSKDSEDLWLIDQSGIGNYAKTAVLERGVRVC